LEEKIMNHDEILNDLVARVARLEADVDHLKPKKPKWNVNPQDHQTIWTHGPEWTEPVDRP
jgi:hypothetical protein